MAATSTHDLYRRWLGELWNGSPSAAQNLVSDDSVGHWPDREVRGATELAAVIGETQDMFSTLTSPSPGYLGSYGWVGVDLVAAEAGWDQVRELIDSSYRNIGTARLVAELDSN